MSSNVVLSVAARNAALDAIAALIDSGLGTPGGLYVSIDFRSGPPPPVVGDVAGDFLVTAYWYNDDPTFGPAANATITARSQFFHDHSVLVGGDVGHFQLRDSNGLIQFQGTCGDSGDIPVDIQFDNKSLQVGGYITLTSLALTWPE